MKAVRRSSAAALTLAWISAFSAVARPSRTAAAQDAANTDPAFGLFTEICGDCHDSDRIVSKRRTKADWQDVLNQMIDKGASGTGKDFETIFGFLQRQYGKVYVNTAPADELATVLGLSKADADAVVAYRKDHGPFADFDALTKVPNIDVKPLQSHKEAVAF